MVYRIFFWLLDKQYIGCDGDPVKYMLEYKEWVKNNPLTRDMINEANEKYKHIAQSDVDEYHNKIYGGDSDDISETKSVQKMDFYIPKICIDRSGFPAGDEEREKWVKIFAGMYGFDPIRMNQICEKLTDEQLMTKIKTEVDKYTGNLKDGPIISISSDCMEYLSFGTNKEKCNIDDDVLDLIKKKMSKVSNFQALKHTVKSKLQLLKQTFTSPKDKKAIDKVESTGSLEGTDPSPELKDKLKQIFGGIGDTIKQFITPTKPVNIEPSLPNVMDIQKRAGLDSNEKLVNILFVRHGFSCSNLLKEIMIGSKDFKTHTQYRDPPLTAIGETESRELGKKTVEIIEKQGFRINVVGASALIRAIQTAATMFPESKEVVRLPYITEINKLAATDIPMALDKQKQIMKNVKVKELDGISQMDYAKSNYAEFIKWLGSNIEAVVDTDIINKGVTMAVVTHGGFMKTQIFGNPKLNVNNNDSYLTSFKYNTETKNLTPVDGKFYKVHTTEKKPRNHICDKNCTPIKTNTNPIVKKLLDKVMECPMYKGKNVENFEYNSTDKVLTLEYPKGTTENIKLNETPEGKDIANKLNSQWPKATRHQQRSLIKLAIKSLNTRKPMDALEVMQEMHKIMDGVARDTTSTKVQLLEEQLRVAKAKLSTFPKTVEGGKALGEWWEECKALTLREFGRERTLEGDVKTAKEETKRIQLLMDVAHVKQKEELQKIQKELDDIESKLGRNIIEIRRLKNEKGTLQAQLDGNNETINTSTEKITENTQKIDELQNELTQSIKQQQNQLQTTSNFILQINGKRSRNKGVNR